MNMLDKAENLQDVLAGLPDYVHEKPDIDA